MKKLGEHHRQLRERTSISHPDQNSNRTRTFSNYQTSDDMKKKLCGETKIGVFTSLNVWQFKINDFKYRHMYFNAQIGVRTYKKSLWSSITSKIVKMVLAFFIFIS